MKFLSENGYSTLRLDEAVGYLAAGGANQRQVVLTFDDGYRDFYTEAYPILRRHGLTATVFLVTAATGNQRRRFQDNDCLTWDEVRQLHADGICIGSHTVNHRELWSLGASEVDYEVTRSKEAIEEVIGDWVKSFSYPFAFPEADDSFTSRFGELLEKRGYENGVSTIIGTTQRSDDRFFLPRLPISSWDDLKFLRAKLEGGYDWLHYPQWFCKKLRRRHR